VKKCIELFITEGLLNMLLLKKRCSIKDIAGIAGRR